MFIPKHTITYNIETIDDDMFLKSVSGENIIQVDLTNVGGGAAAFTKARNMYLTKVLRVAALAKEDKDMYVGVVAWTYTDKLGNTYENGKFTI